MKLCGLIGLKETQRILEHKKRAKTIFQWSLILGAQFEILGPVEHYFIAPTIYRAMLKSSNFYSWEYLMVLQNKIQMHHICYPVNEEHSISRLLQEVPFQVNTHRYAETSSVITELQSRCLVPTSASAPYTLAVDLQQSFKKGGNFDSIQTCLHSLKISLSAFRWQFGSSENLYFSYWQYFQWSGPSPKSPRLSFPPGAPLFLLITDLPQV